MLLLSGCCRSRSLFWLLLSGCCCWLRGVLLRLGLVGDSITTRCLAAFIHLLWRLCTCMCACRADSAQLTAAEEVSQRHVLR